MHKTSANNAQSTTAPLSLLRLIAEDADFRAKVESDPVAAFAEHGIHLSSVPDQITLPELSAQISDDKDPDDDDSTYRLPWMGIL